MSDTAGGLPLVEELRWDSEFFGFPIARINAPGLSGAELSAAISECRSRGIQCAYLLCAGDAAARVTSAVRLGFRLIDLRVTLDGKVSPTAARAGGARRAESEDLPELARLARTAFEHSRFFVDGRFPRERVEDLFERWMERDVESANGVVAVSERAGKRAGFASGSIESDGSARVGLVGVAPGFRGLGVGREVVTGLLAFLAERGAGKVSVVTQGRNHTALRLYEECGFRTSSIGIWLHWWLDENPV